MTQRHCVLIVIFCVLAACSGRSSFQFNSQTHIVRKGETLFAIAWRYDKATADIARWNRLGDGSLIYPGQRLRLTGSAAVTRSTPSPSSRKDSQSKQPLKPLPAIPSEPAPKLGWPTKGLISVEFGEKPGTGTGILIDGKAGQAIVAVALGRVVYAGSGLIGYGKLVILKHNSTYLSAYGYNASLRVKEGDKIRKGQEIATMGEGPENKARLHFEIRRNGKPVSPRQYLPVK
jgi:lipoprotein NlpD